MKTYDNTESFVSCVIAFTKTTGHHFGCYCMYLQNGDTPRMTRRKRVISVFEWVKLRFTQKENTAQCCYSYRMKRGMHCALTNKFFNQLIKISLELKIKTTASLWGFHSDLWSSVWVAQRFWMHAVRTQLDDDLWPTAKLINMPKMEQRCRKWLPFFGENVKFLLAALFKRIRNNSNTDFLKGLPNYFKEIVISSCFSQQKKNIFKLLQRR